MLRYIAGKDAGGVTETGNDSCVTTDLQFKVRTTSRDEEKEIIQNSLEFRKGNGLEFIWSKVSKKKKKYSRTTRLHGTGLNTT